MVETGIRNPELVSQLCVECGLCCSGALFSYASMPEADVELARSLGMEITHVDGVPAFRLPCPRLSGTVCSVYGQRRPHPCGAFYCKLATRVDTGDVTLAEAKNIVTQTRSMFESISDAVNPDEARRAAISRWYRERQQQDKPSAPIDLRMTALLLAMKKMFLHSDDAVQEKQ
jgi:hypothetical protein